MLRRILAWIALIFLIIIIVNILFIHVYVTESVVIFLLYVLILYFGKRRNYINTDGQTTKEMDDLTQTPETTDDSTTGDNTHKEEMSIIDQTNNISNNN